MNLIRPLTAAALAAVVAAPAVAEDDQKIYLNPSIGFQLFDHERDLSESATYGFGLEFRFLPRWAAEAVYSRADADRKGAPGHSELESYRLDGLYYFGTPSETWNPYLSAGVGHAEFDGRTTRETKGTDHEETRVNVGAGVRYNINDRISLRGEIREFHGIDESTFDTLASIGFSVGFGRSTTPAGPEDSDSDGVNDANDRCPGTTFNTRVDAQGCEQQEDSDRDGVANSRDQCPGTASGTKVDDTGCEGVSETVETIELEVQFPTNSSVIGDRYDREIHRVAEFMKEHPETTVEIGGHSDNTGEASYNEVLSQRRAEAVAERLVDALGIAPDRVSAVGYGESQPVASNDTASGRAENRRVEAQIQVQR